MCYMYFPYSLGSIGTIHYDIALISLEKKHLNVISGMLSIAACAFSEDRSVEAGKNVRYSTGSHR